MSSSKAISRILSGGGSGPTDESEYRTFVDSGGRPQMGFMVEQADGTCDGFLYHSLDNMRLFARHGHDFLTFTHRGTAVTMQGDGLKEIFRAIMRHTLMEIHGPDGRMPRAGDPVITRLEVTPADQNTPPIRLAKG